jgi:NAD+ kinase
LRESKKIILYPNAGHDAGFEMTRKVGEILEKYGRSIVFCPLFIDDECINTLPPGFKISDIEAELPSAEMIVTFGGDGTILRAARAAADLGVPILGINLGGKGFMAELEADDIGLIERAAIGSYKLGRRMMLDVEVVRGNETICRDFALNDVVIRGDNKVIDLTLFGDGQRISHFSGDGAVIATPTGSTAYSMAAGGPIVEPAALNIIVTPICAHALETKAFVLISDRRVSVEIGYKKQNPSYMSVDGGNHVSVQSGDVINVHKSEKCTRFVRLSDMSFYKKVSEKLGEKL